MDYLAFLDQLLLDALAFCDKEESYDYIKAQRYNIEFDPDLTDEERQAAFLGLRAAQVIDLSKRDEIEEIRKDIFRILYPGCFRASTSFIDHDKLGAAFWKDSGLRDDLGEACWIYYYEGSDPGHSDATVHVVGHMKAEEQDTADFLLGARVEAFLNHLDSLPAAA